MRDFYRRLNIKRNLSDGKVLAEAKLCSNKALREEASFVFSSKSRKAAYDNLNDTLAVIGRLRPSLGLSHTDKWSDEIADEYTDNSRVISPLLPDLLKRIQLMHQRAISERDSAKRRRYFGWVWKGAAAVGVIVLLINENNNSGERSTSYATSGSTTTSSSSKEFSQQHQAQTFPFHGKTINLTSRDPAAPFEIQTSSGNNYVVKLKEVGSGGRDAIIVYAHGGSPVNIEVPLGNYEMYYAAGKTWYGDALFFGPETVYSKSDSTFNFHVQGNQVMGYTVTLYTVSNGNMQTRRVSPQDF